MYVLNKICISFGSTIKKKESNGYILAFFFFLSSFLHRTMILFLYIYIEEEERNLYNYVFLSLDFKRRMHICCSKKKFITTKFLIHY